jgi:hemerythrin-like metal-binding protein
MENYFEWDASLYSIGVNAMDEEHQVLIGLMNDLQRLHEQGATVADQGKALVKLANYTRKHFTDEEGFMSRVGFPGLRHHQLIHQQLLARLDEFAAEFQRNGKLPDGLFAFLRIWLKSHIRGIDMKYAEHSRHAA